MESNLRKTIQLKAKQPELKSLRDLSRKMKSAQRTIFVKRYGKILDLLEVEVQVGALTALAQFYDPPLRCFTFQDFQLAPTLEEFEYIFGYSLRDRGPYLCMGHYPSLQTIATSLKIDIRELASRKETKGGVDGFSRKHLEKQAQHLAENGEWDEFMDMLALIIYGIVLFPNIDDFVDFAAIDVFLAYKHNRRNPVPAILSDIYHTLTVRHEKKRGMILCCLPALYVWFTIHMFKNRGWVETKSNRDWAQSIVNLDERSILWYYRDLERIDVIYRCGDFPNVPLMGTKGCINYNPVLASRQFGYPMRGPPSEESITPFIVYDMNSDIKMLHRIRRAWDHVNRKGRDLGVGSGVANKSYNQWLKERIQEVKLPFRISVPASEDIPVQSPMSSEEVEKLKEALVQAEEERKRLKMELNKARQECKIAQKEGAKKQLFIEMANKRARVEKECKLKTQSCLRGANRELGLRRQERDKALTNAEQWREAWKESKTTERNVRRQLEDLKQQLKEVVAEYERRIQDEKQRNQELVLEYQADLSERAEYTEELYRQIEFLNRITKDYEEERRLWAHNFMNRALQISQMLTDASHMLQRAEGMTNPLTTPIEIYDFLECCKDMIGQMKNMANPNK